MKYKAKTKDCHLLVKVKTSIGEKIDTKELDRFARVYLRGFLAPKNIKNNQAEYSGPVGIPLSERFSKPISKRDFFFIIEQVVVAIQKLNANQFQVHNLNMDLSHIYINKITKEIHFIYIPVISKKYNPNIIEMLETMIYSSRPMEDRDTEYVSRFKYFLNNLNPIDFDKIEKYICKEDRSVVDTIKKFNAGQSGFITDKRDERLKHDMKDDEATDLLRDDDATGLLDDDTDILDDEDEATGLLNCSDDEATGLLNNDEEGTALLNEENGGKYGVSYPTLHRILTDEIIRINKPVFRLGKERSYVDYFVTNNNAVSRSHADIVTRGSKYFVIDLNSKNRTFINGQPLPPHYETEICDGDELKLGNEAFEFHVEN